MVTVGGWIVSLTRFSEYDKLNMVGPGGKEVLIALTNAVPFVTVGGFRSADSNGSSRGLAIVTLATPETPFKSGESGPWDEVSGMVITWLIW